METRSNIITAFQYLKMAKMSFEDLQREMPNTDCDKMAKKYINKIDWIYTDFITISKFDRPTINSLKYQFEGDILSIPEILNTLSLLDDSQRELVEEVAKALYKGEEITFEEKDNK
jgi:hypothetical protein